MQRGTSYEEPGRRIEQVEELRRVVGIAHRDEPRTGRFQCPPRFVGTDRSGQRPVRLAGGLAAENGLETVSGGSALLGQLQQPAGSQGSEMEQDDQGGAITLRLGETLRPRQRTPIRAAPPASAATSLAP